MSYRSYGGFAEGFKGGFGLMNDVMDRRARKEIADEENRLKGIQLDNDKTYRQGLIDAQNEQNRIENEKLTWSKDPNNPDNIRTTAQGGLYDSQSNLVSAQAGETKVDTDIKQDNFQQVKDKRSTKERQMDAAANVQQFLNLGNQVLKGERTLTPEVVARLGDFKERASGSLLDLDKAIDPANQYQQMQFMDVLQKMSSGDMAGIRKEPVRDVMNVVLRANNLQGKGELVTSETHPYAGEYADRGLVVMGKSITSVNLTDKGTLLAKVDVEVQNPETGEQFVYEAPMTIGRRGSSDPVDMTFQQVVDAAGGYFTYANAMAPYGEMLTEINRRMYDSSRTEGAFDEKTNLLMAEYKQNNTDLEAPSPVKGKSVGDFITDPVGMKRYFQAAILDPDMLEESPESIADNNYSLMASSQPIQEIERLLGKNMSRSQVLQAALYLDMDDRGRIDVDPKVRGQWNKFKNRILGRKNAKNRRNR